MRRSIGNAHSLAATTVWLCLCVSVVRASPGVHSDEIILEWKQIFVNILGGPSFSMMVEPDETGVDLKWDIYELEGIPDTYMRPKVGDIMIDFTNRLSDFNISDQTILTVDISDTLDIEPVTFYVRTRDGRELGVTAKLGKSVASLKDNITQWTGIPQMEQRLLCNGKELRDERKLLHYRVENETMLSFGRPLAECRQEATILVKTLSGATIEVEVNLVDTVTDLKERIWEKAGIPANVQRLSFNGRMIIGVDHLCDLGMEAGSTVYMYLYSAHITSLDQVAMLRDPHAAYPVNNYRAPIFREVEDVGESVRSGRGRPASLYKDARNWLARSGHRPFFINNMFDPVAHLSPDPDLDGSIKSCQESIENFTRREGDRRAVALRARLNLTKAVRPYREAANLTSAYYTGRILGITLGGGSTHESQKQPVLLGADVNNWAPDAFSDTSVMRLFDISERVRRALARAEQTGEGIISIASQMRINRAILFSYLEALTGVPQPVEYNQPREVEECGICRDDLAAESAIKLDCGHAFHDNCLVPWALREIFDMHYIANCPHCRQSFSLSSRCLKIAELEEPEYQVNYNE